MPPQKASKRVGYTIWWNNKALLILIAVCSMLTLVLELIQLRRS